MLWCFLIQVIESTACVRLHWSNLDLMLQCVPILGRGFETGGYKCECLQGYEYPFEDLITYFDGQLVEAEFNNIVANKPTR